MLYSKVDKLLGTSINDVQYRNVNKGGGPSLTEDKPPVLPMPPSMSPITKSSFYRSSSSLSSRSSEMDKMSLDLHNQDQHRFSTTTTTIKRSPDFIHFNQGRRNALDPTSSPIYNQGAIQYNIRQMPETAFNDFSFKSTSMVKDQSRIRIEDPKSSDQDRQREAKLAQRNSRSIANLRKARESQDDKGMPGTASLAEHKLSRRSSIENLKRDQYRTYENIPKNLFIDSTNSKKTKQIPENEQGLRKRSESVGQAESPYQDVFPRALSPLLPSKANEFSSVSNSTLDQPVTPNNSNIKSKWSSSSTDSNAHHTPSLMAGLTSPISFSSYPTSTPPSSASQSAFRDSTELNSISSPKGNIKVSPSAYSNHSFKSMQREGFDPNSRRTKYADIRMFPLVRREALRNCLMDENVTKVEATVRKGLMRKRDVNERFVVLTTNARQIQGQLSAKLASLTGAQSIGQAKFSFNDLNGSDPFVILHCFKSDHSLAKEEERLCLDSHSFVAVAETSSSFQIDREVWALKIAGHVTSNNPPKSRAAEQQQSQWTLQFDTKHRMLKWQVILRALIFGLNEADQVFRIGPPLHSIKHAPSTNSISSASTLASSKDYNYINPLHVRSESYEEKFGSNNSPRSSPRNPYFANKEGDLSKFIASTGSFSMGSNRTSTFVANQAAQIAPSPIMSQENVLPKQYELHQNPATTTIYRVDTSRDSKRPSVQSRDMALEEKLIAEIKANTLSDKRGEQDVNQTKAPAITAQSRKRSASVPHSRPYKPDRLSVDSAVIVPSSPTSPLPSSASSQSVTSSLSLMKRTPTRPQQLPPPAVPPPVIPRPPSSSARSDGSHQHNQNQEDAAAAKIRKMRTEVALAMACAAAPRSMSMMSYFTDFSEDFSAEISKRCSAESNVKNGEKGSGVESSGKEEDVTDDRTKAKKYSTLTKSDTDEIDAIYAMIDLSYNIYGLSTASNEQNIFVPDPESMTSSNHSNSVYYDEFIQDPFQRMGTIKIDSASLQKARADLRTRSISISMEDREQDASRSGSMRLQKRRSSLNKASIPFNSEVDERNDIIPYLKNSNKSENGREENFSAESELKTSPQTGLAI